MSNFISLLNIALLVTACWVAETEMQCLTERVWKSFYFWDYNFQNPPVSMASELLVISPLNQGTSLRYRVDIICVMLYLSPYRGQVGNFLPTKNVQLLLPLLLFSVSPQAATT